MDTVETLIMSPPARRLPSDGPDGYAQAWFPICNADDIGPGEMKGIDVMQGKVVAFRDESGTPHVMSAFCPHLGADLSIGDVVDDTIRCAFHHWRYDGTGACVATGGGDRVPPKASVFRFPTVEKFGFIYMFNGPEAWWQMPDFPYPEEELIGFGKIDTTLECQNWIPRCNTPDYQHIAVLHGVTFDKEPEPEDFEWTDINFRYNFKGVTRDGKPMDADVGIWGTCFFYHSSTFNGRWAGIISGGRPLGPERSVHGLRIFLRKADGTDEENEAALAEFWEYAKGVRDEDIPIWNTMRFRQGTLSKSDRPLGRYFELLRNFPRARPVWETEH